MPQQNYKQKTKLLLIGFGDVNQRLANVKKADSDVTAVRRSEMFFPDVHCKAGDATDRRFIRSLLNDKPDQIVITLSPSDHSEKGYVDTYLAATKALVASATQLEQTPEVIFISSSSVYGQNCGEIIDEESECSPTGYNGKILLRAEQCLLNSNLSTTVIRFSGIYGPGKFRLINKSIDPDRAPAESTHWTNRIHAEDCAGVIKHILDTPKHKRHSIYLASDNLPVEQETVLNWLKQKLLGIGPNRVPRKNERRIQTGKRCDNSRLIESGYRFSYPSYQEGFVPIITEYRQGVKRA